MSSYGAAIGRQQGKADTDNNGLARFMLQIEIPKGIKFGNEPELSSQYSQGTPNGIIGFSWALGGVSSIHLGAPRVVYDKLNPPPADYNSAKPKLILDGTDLLNIKGLYHEPDTVYTTETNNTGLAVTSLGVGKGFEAVDNMGRRTEYGTTPDSCVISTHSGDTREWRVKKQTDCHGNTVVYNYIVSPQAPEATKDVNTSYLSSIQYCSNSMTNVPATRFVNFDYIPRPDLIKQSVAGDIVTWANLLSSISVGVDVADVSSVHRTYSLHYDQSPGTSDSYLYQVIESAGTGAQKVDLLPSTFTYTVPGVDASSLFKTVPASPFSAEHDVFALAPLNTTGRGLADMACMVWDQGSKNLTVKTYMADRNDTDRTVSWTPSQNNVQLNMPNWDPTKQDVEMPDFLTPDLHGDGRSDLIIPFSNSQGNLEFFLSQSCGVGLTAVQKNVQTSFPWLPKSMFKAMDMTGTGVADVVQIFQKQDTSSISFRNFPGIADDAGSIGLGDAFTTDTQYAFDNTIDWFLLRHSGTGAVSLVRVWQEFLTNDPNQYNIKTTSFRCAKSFDSSEGFDPAGIDCTIGGPFPKQDPSEPAWSVLTCDINGDGTQDIVLGKAVYTSPNITFNLQVSLGDGLGGFDKVSEITQTHPAPQPKGDGMFSVTNLSGGLYPTLAYVYQQSDTNDFVCFSVDGRSDASVSPVTQYPVTPNPGTDNTQVMPVDLSGTGMGDWLFYSLTNGTPTTVPVYNTAHPTDLLLSAENSMGLVTTLGYGCLSDSTVYDSTVDWKDYNDIETANYIVQGAPNYVVTSLTHTNDPTVNSAAFNISIQKTYTKAIVNSQGRGWMGFESIKTANLTDNVLTVEHYFQEVAKIGLKSQIDTFQLVDQQLVSSQTTDYDPVQVSSNGWKIYHVNKMFDKLEIDGPSGRMQLTEFASDDYGNILTKHSLETHAGTAVFESWQRCTYTTINGITSLLTGKKLTALETNADVSTFQPGDVALTQYTYDNQTALLTSEMRWSDDLGKYLVTTYAFDGYGNEISKTDPAGLTTSTTYDPTFHNLAIEQTEKGTGVLTTQYTAYDQASGEVVARLETDGRLTCAKVDGFGRNVETRMESIVPGAASMKAADFLGQSPYVALDSFAQELSSSSCLLDPSQKHSYSCFTSAGGKAYVMTTTLSYFNEEDSGQHEVVNVHDCSNQQIMQRSRQGTDPSKNNPSATRVSWEYRRYDSRGNTHFQSFPIQSAAWDNFEYQPSVTEGTTSTFDSLGRVLTQSRPSHDDPAVTIVSCLTYATGGGTVTEAISGPDPNTGSKDILFWSAPRVYVAIDGKEHVIAAANPHTTPADPNTTPSEFTYDVSGNLTLAIDPRGQREERTYNSLGQLRTLDNGYQRMVDPAKPSTQLAMTYEYDGTGHLHSTTNANEEMTTFETDSKGRPISKTGWDGRVLVYEYDAQGREALSSMTVYPKGQDSPMESKLSFDYDRLGRLQSRTLTLADGTAYTTTLSYDWQGQTTRKTYPNGAVKESRYIGSLLSYSQVSQGLAGGPAETWLDGNFEYTDATGKPNNIAIGQAGMNINFYHSFTYDLQAYPTGHTLQELASAGQPTILVGEQYSYNGMSQLCQRTDAVTNVATKYDYSGKRLSGSTIGDAASMAYTYDESGNLLTKGDTTITYSSNGAHGAAGSSTVFDILYDRAGRVVKRSTLNDALDFTYNSFGLLASYNNSANAETVITCGPDGKTIQCENPGTAGSTIIISDDYNVQRQPDGSTVTTVKLFGAGMLLGSVSQTTGAGQTTQAATVVYTDTKGNVTHRFRASDASLVESITYDDFGTPTLQPGPSADPLPDHTSTYESHRLDTPTGLLDFGARWYDPLVARFTSPDTILDIPHLARTDGLNRLAFETNDPINHVDPSGHWSLSAIAGAVLGAALVVGAVALTIATGGAAAPLATAAAAGALASGGIAGISYSFDHRNERGGKFWGGYAATVLVNAAVGGATGALGAVATPARLVCATGRLGQAAGWSLSTSAENFLGGVAAVGAKALIGAAASLVHTVAHNAIENRFYGTHYGLFEGAGMAAAQGAAMGFLAGGFKAFRYKGFTPTMTTGRAIKSGLTGAALIGLKAGYAVADAEHIPDRAKSRVEQKAAEIYHEQQTQFRALSNLVGSSGFVGTLHQDLLRNQSFVNYG